MGAVYDGPARWHGRRSFWPGALAGAKVTVQNELSGYKQDTTTSNQTYATIPAQNCSACSVGCVLVRLINTRWSTYAIPLALLPRTSGRSLRDTFF